MKKTRSRKSRDTVLLNGCTRVLIVIESSVVDPDPDPDSGF
jgi:hypothetical protein